VRKKLSTTISLTFDTVNILNINTRYSMMLRLLYFAAMCKGVLSSLSLTFISRFLLNKESMIGFASTSFSNFKMKSESQEISRKKV